MTEFGSLADVGRWIAGATDESKTVIDDGEGSWMEGRVRAADVADMVLDRIVEAGDTGITIPELVNQTGLPYRVLHNVTWTLEGSPEPSPSSPNYGIPRYPDQIRARRLNTGDRTVRYAATSHESRAAASSQRNEPDATEDPDGRFLVNAAGDIYARELPDGSSEVVDPDEWGWAGPDHRVPAEHRYTIDELAALPGITVSVTADKSFVPGPKQRSGRWMEWPNGAAPPAHYSAKRGAGGYFSRFSDVLGYVAASLPRNPESSPYRVHDFVQGHRLEIHYKPPPVGPGGPGLVYVLDDSHALKFGHTTRAPAIRVNDLQTGNPRPLRTMATIAPASPSVESHLHRKLDAWLVRGEWYAREPILAAVHDAGGWAPYLQDLLPPGAWEISIHPRAEET